jgi:hypothetical protein
MSGIIPPSVVNYDWTVRIDDPSYLNVSFPFRVKIESIWFTTQQIYNGTSGLWEMGDGAVDIETTERLLRLAAFKSKNSKTQHNIYDNPSDWLFAFENVPWDGDVNENLKPTMWLGNPDDAAGRVGAFGTQQYWGNGSLDIRSTAATPIDKARAQNNSWYNFNLWNERTYLADVAVMNTDEILQLFVYSDGGDWSGYEDDAKVTISVAYTGMHNEEAISASAKPWVEWWND